MFSRILYSACEKCIALRKQLKYKFHTVFHEARTRLLFLLQRRFWTTGWDCYSKAPETAWTTTLRSSVSLSAER